MKKYGYPCAAVGFAFDVENTVTAMGVTKIENV